MILTKMSVFHLPLLLIFGVFTTLAFNNCGQQANQASLANLNDPDLKNRYSKIIDSRYSIESCDVAEAFACDFHNYGSQVDDSFPATDCIEVEGLSSCIEVMTINIDTTEALENCDTCDDPNEEARFFEKYFQCYHTEIMAEGQRPVRSSGKTLEESIKSLRENCRTFFKGEQQ